MIVRKNEMTEISSYQALVKSHYNKHKGTHIIPNKCNAVMASSLTIYKIGKRRNGNLIQKLAV